LTGTGVVNVVSSARLAGSNSTDSKMPDKAFFDTNILLYAFSARDSRQNVALDLLLAGGTIGVQTLNEFVNVITGKL